MDFSHLDEQGQAKMVDISSKDISRRSAKAKGLIFLHKTTIEKIKNNLIKKGDVLSVARIAAISGGKKTPELIPLCHNILISKIDISFNILDEKIEIIAEAVCQARAFGPRFQVWHGGAVSNQPETGPGMPGQNSGRSLDE